MGKTIHFDRYKILEIKPGVYVKDVRDDENVTVTTDIKKAHKWGWLEYGEHLNKPQLLCNGTYRTHIISYELEDE